MKKLVCAPLCVAVLGLCTFTSAMAQDDGGVAAIGPDVTVSTIDNMTKYGSVGNLTGYAMTTVSCNIGDQQAIWIDCSSGPNCNQHPVISQNLYRLKTVDGATRFEEVGMSWLKHGFCGADASGANCLAVCNNDGTCDGLGVGCTDTYGAGLNADQQDLGPKSEINAFTGAYPYPYVRGWNQTGNAIYKRMQIKTEDVDPALNPGANSTATNAQTKYFGECQYIVTDEPVARRFNNVSHRRVVVGALSGGGYNMSFQGTMVPQKSAIEAWPANDTNVSLVQVNVPNEGRFILGYKVTNLQNGKWRYEYALYNMNSDRSGQSFIIDAPDWLNYSNFGFHDVDYHSGEPYSAADWQWSKQPGLLGWYTETYAQNANANALRWGTLYNFRVDVDVPPRMGTVRVGLFKPATNGAPTEVTVGALVPAPLGDMNCDALVNNFDIDPFVMAVTDMPSYLAAFPNCNGNNGDLNGDGTFNNFDIDAFVEMITR